jgi:hypothetical protein
VQTGRQMDADLLAKVHADLERSGPRHEARA